MNTAESWAEQDAAARDALDPAPTDVVVEAIRLTDHPTLTAEETGDIPFLELLASMFDPAPPQDRIELPALSTTSIKDAASALVRTLAVQRGRINHYMPVPGETGLRTDDLLDFLERYGHEYQITVFRAADVRTGSLLDVTPITRAARAEGTDVVWDWTGASDWIPTPDNFDDVSLVFWSQYRSLLDGREIPAGFWQPAAMPIPEPLTLTRADGAVRDRAARLTGFARHAIAGMTGVTALVPTDRWSSVPVLILDAGDDAGAVADTLGSGATGFMSVTRYGSRVVALPDGAGGTYAQIVSTLAALRLNP